MVVKYRLHTWSESKVTFNNDIGYNIIRESVDSLCRDETDAPIT